MSTLKQRLTAKQKLVRSQIDKLVRARRVAAKAGKVDEALTKVLKDEVVLGHLKVGPHRGYVYTILLEYTPETGLDMDRIVADHSEAWLDKYRKKGKKLKLSVVKPEQPAKAA